MPTQTNWPPKDGDITHLIERLDAFEERVNVRFEALSARIYPGVERPWMKICGEIHARDGLVISQRLSAVVTVFDPKGRMFSKKEFVVYPDKFYGFEAFTFEFPDLEPVAKIRVYPQRA